MKIKKILQIALVSICTTTSIFAYDKPIVSDIRAEYSKGTKINILWKLPENLESPITKLLLYRDTKPIKNFDDINNATFIAQLDGFDAGYTDSLKDYRDYFYAVVAYTDKPYTLIMPSMNATVNGVRIKEKQTSTQKPKKDAEEKLYPSGTLRETPLPYLDLIEGMDNTENKISKNTTNMAKDLGVRTKKTTKMLEPFYFEEDLISPERGDGYFLFQILREHFVRGSYKESITQLKRLTGTNISKDVEDRATFYLGEAYYFTGDFENAVRSFVKVQQVFPVQTKKWIESSLDMLEF